MNYVKKEPGKAVKGVIVCNGVMPAFEKEFSSLRNIKIMRYGWKLDVAEL